MTKKTRKNSKDYIWLMSTLFSDSVYPFVKGRYNLTEEEYKQYRDKNTFVVDKVTKKKYTTYVLYVDKYATIKSKQDDKKVKTRKRRKTTRKRKA